MRLLLVHGSLSAYRLSRLIKYSFYKNIIFGFLLFYYQFYNGFSGQALVDGISAAAYNVVFTSIPILLFAVLDRPVVRHAFLQRKASNSIVQSFARVLAGINRVSPTFKSPCACCHRILDELRQYLQAKVKLSIGLMLLQDTGLAIAMLAKVNH